MSHASWGCAKPQCAQCELQTALDQVQKCLTSYTKLRDEHDKYNLHTPNWWYYNGAVHAYMFAQDLLLSIASFIKE
jgi:hypothetical protein